ncbi:hypothetical protein PV08_02318 [Exophiala spinifera]|uniref:Uncharacterized protein n=1 Tax=Exophiala spinifera TaxID=91928 RepID=A0A0D1YS42_9EURO|nr:uncharacterized protein PV08_02318 [Exophiala spinifera]KIW18031.1 hypothetical protein PV08_02318 [Exophiala spinifera]
MSLTRVQPTATQDHILLAPTGRYAPRTTPIATESSPPRQATHMTSELQRPAKAITLWGQSTDQERADCVGTQWGQKFNSQWCWNVKGPLNDDIWRERTLPVLNRLENDNCSHLYGTGGKHEMRSFHFSLLSRTDDPGTASPTVLIMIGDRKIGLKMKKLFENHPHFQDLNTGFGIEVLGKSRLFRFPATDEPPPGSSQQRLHSHSASSLCGRGVLVPMHPGTMCKRATIGGVICNPGTCEFFAVTVAHCFSLDSSLARPEDSVSSEGSSLGEDSEDDDITVPAKSDGSEVSQAATDGDWLLDAICGAYTDTSLPRTAAALPLSPKHSEYIGCINLQRRNFEDAAASEESAQYSKELDWALIRITVPKFLQINQVETPWNTCLYPSSVVRNSDALDCYAILAAGRSGIREVSFSGTVTSVKFPWSTTAQMLWTVEADLAEGDSGSWILSTNGNSVYGMVVASIPTLRIAYVARAQDIFESIRSAWHINCDIDDMLPKEIDGVIQMGHNPLNTFGSAAKASSSTKPATGSKPHGSEEPSPSRKISLSGAFKLISQYTRKALQAPQTLGMGILPYTILPPVQIPITPLSFLASILATNTPKTSFIPQEPEIPVRVDIAVTSDIIAAAGAGHKLSLMLNAIRYNKPSNGLEVHSISSEVTFLAFMLKQIGVVLQGNDHVYMPEPFSIAQRIAHTSSSVLDELERTLNYVQKSSTDPTTTQPTSQQGFELSFKKHRVAYLLATIEHLRLSLTAMLGILQLAKLMASTIPCYPAEEASTKDEAIRHQRLEAQNSLVVRQWQMTKIDKLFQDSQKEEEEDGLEHIPTGFVGEFRPVSLGKIDDTLARIIRSSAEMIDASNQAIDEFLKRWTNWREVDERRNNCLFRCLPDSSDYDLARGKGMPFTEQRAQQEDSLLGVGSCYVGGPRVNWSILHSAAASGEVLWRQERDLEDRLLFIDGIDEGEMRTSHR